MRTLKISIVQKVADPGHVVIHRLNRSEYDNTIRDLTGVDFKLAESFPVQGGGGEGFDNNSEVMFFPVIYMEKYLEAARKIASHAVITYNDPITFSPSSKGVRNPSQYKTDADFAYKAFFADWRTKRQVPNWKKEYEKYSYEAMKFLTEHKSTKPLDDQLFAYAKKRDLEPGYLENFRSYLNNLKHEKNPWAYWSMEEWIDKRLSKKAVTDEELKSMAATFSKKSKYIQSNQFNGSLSKEQKART